MPKLVFKETISREMEISIDSLCELVNSLSKNERAKLLKKLNSKTIKLSPFKKDKIKSILSDFEITNLYEDDFLKDLKEGLAKSSVHKSVNRSN